MLSRHVVRSVLTVGLVCASVCQVFVCVCVFAWMFSRSGEYRHHDGSGFSVCGSLVQLTF